MGIQKFSYWDLKNFLFLIVSNSRLIYTYGQFSFDMKTCQEIIVLIVNYKN